LEDLLGRQITAEQGGAVLSVVTAMARAYTRGQGFTNGVPNDDIAAVILSAASRLCTNTISAQVTTYEVHGPDAVRFEGKEFAWSMAELYVLNRWRRRAG
jgi:hypothetical protein